MINPLLAFLAGLLTIAALCVLPMLPVVLGTSIGQRDRSRPLFIALGFEWLNMHMNGLLNRMNTVGNGKLGGLAALLLGCYSLGAALPMLGIAYGGQYDSAVAV
ncbi:hypothetical protein [Polaromonas sp.]|uniref:hypothetical protein n=1 Tax=Polaromonas sp. TaxID=1869339 RepID=UPI0032639C1E